MSGELVLLVDDEVNILELARVYLEREGFRVLSVQDGLEALKTIEGSRPALVVLDVMLPGMDGFTICRRLRAELNPIHILMLTARDDDVDKILGLEFGADDYLTKPFNPRELVARVKAILRRSEWKSQGQEAIQFGKILIDPARREVMVDDRIVNLRTKEFDLLWVLAEHKGLVMSREKLLELAWGYDFFGQTRTVDVHVSHLRKKFADTDLHIESVSGIGYKLVF